MADTNYTLALDIAADGAAALQAADAIEKRYASLGAGIGDTVRKALEDAFSAAAQTLDAALQQAAKGFSDAMKGAVPAPPPPPEPAPERQEPPAEEQQSPGDDALAKALQEAAKAVGDSTKAIEAATKSIDEATKAIGEGHSTPPPAPPAPPPQPPAAPAAPGGPAAQAAQAAVSPIRSALAVAAKAVILPFKVLGKVLGAVAGVFKALFAAVKAVVSAIASLVKSAFRLVKSLAKTLLAFAGAVAAAGFAFVKAMGPAAEVETRQVRLAMQMRSGDKSARRLRGASAYAGATGFQRDDIFGAAEALRGMGDNSARSLRAAGNAAAFFGKNVADVVGLLEKVKDRSGALDAIKELGLDRRKARRLGIRFDREGEMTTRPKKAYKAVLAYMEKEYRGSAARMAGTWEGVTGRLKNSATAALSGGFMGALKPMTDFVKRNLIPLVDDVGKYLAKVDWNKVLSGPLTALRAVANTVRRLLDPAQRAEAVQDIKDMWAGIKEVGWSLVKGAAKVLGAVFMDFGEALWSWTRNGGLMDLLSASWDTLKAILQGALALLQAILAQFSNRLKDEVVMLWERILGNDDTGVSASKRLNEKLAMNDVLRKYGGDAVARSTSIEEQHKLVWNGKYKNGPHGERLRQYEWKTARTPVHSYAFRKDAPIEARQFYQQRLAERMGWNENTGMDAARASLANAGASWASAREKFGQSAGKWNWRGARTSDAIDQAGKDISAASSKLAASVKAAAAPDNSAARFGVAAKVNPRIEQLNNELQRLKHEALERGAFVRRNGEFRTVIGNRRLDPRAVKDQYGDDLGDFLKESEKRLREIQKKSKEIDRVRRNPASKVSVPGAKSAEKADETARNTGNTVAAIASLEKKIDEISKRLNPIIQAYATA